MAVRKAETTWNGTLKDGNGSMTVESGAIDVPFTFSTRFGAEKGTNPEELIGAAHAGCFSMFLSAVLSNDGFSPTRIHTQAAVSLGKDDTGPVIENITLTTEAEIPDISEEKFAEFVAIAKSNCPISRALASVPEITVSAKLV
ncbi:MAG: OsmC family protein [Methylococcales bacterium]|nr:OsmC family protein [Methylococcales bacterium]